MPTELHFSPASNGAFAFDTGVLSGTLRHEGRSIGLVPIVHKPTGIELAAGEGLFNHYRVFTRGKRYGYGARRWPSTAHLDADGSVEVIWERTADRPFELRGQYSWVSPNTLELITTVRAAETLEAYEVFVASYYQPPFTDSRVLARHTMETPAEGFVEARKELGTWLAFPRDDAGADMIRDGRWDLEPHPLDWRIMPPYARPLAFRRDRVSGVTVIVVAERTSCFGVYTPYGEEAHYSNYLSLFGRDIAAGDSISTRTRLVVLHHPTEAQICALADA